MTERSMTDIDGRTIWRDGGCISRERGPAVVWPDGTKEYRRHGRLHRLDGPAVEAPGISGWYSHGRLGKITAPEWDDWIERAPPGDCRVYHIGFLALDRSRPAVHLLAELLWRAQADGHCHLVQRRIAPNEFAYMAVKSRPSWLGN